MRILVVSYFFPPYNAIGAVRVGKTVKYLRALGHDVRVLTARDQPLSPTLALEVPAECVVSTPWWDVNRPVQALLGGRERVAARGYVVGAGGNRARDLVRRAGAVYKAAVHWPDAQIGWAPFATRAGTRLLREWRPDLVFASAKPVTSLLVARRLARRAGVPWVAEFRDLWTDEGGYSHRGLRRWIDERIEARLLASMAGAVTVTEPLAETLRRRMRGEVEVVFNGFDPSDYPAALPTRDGELSLAYTGMLYEGRQDPTPLFHALRLLRERGRQVRVRFYGRYLDHVARLAHEAGVSEQVEVHAPVSHREATAIQAGADVLLHVLFTNEAERGAFTGKVFEYLGARRPILAVGPQFNGAARLIADRGAGIVLQDPSDIAERLSRWCDEKAASGIPPLPAGLADEFTRERQTRRLEAFLQRVLERVRGAVP